MSSLSERAGDLVQGWPPGGLVVGLLPDPSDPPWAGRGALALALATADRRKPALILDLAPKDTDLAARFGAADEAGFAELVDGEVELWEIVHRHSGGEAFYLPCGLRTPGAELARAPAARTLADRVRDAGRILLVPLDRRGAGEAASAGWVDGFVRLGERGVSSARLSGGAQALGHLERLGETLESPDQTRNARRTEPSRRDSAARERPTGGSRSRMSLPRRRRRSGRLLRKVGLATLAAALVLVAGLTASPWLGGPGWQEVREAAGTVAGEVGGAMPPAAGSTSDPAGAGDSASSPAAAPGDSGDAPPR